MASHAVNYLLKFLSLKWIKVSFDNVSLLLLCMCKEPTQWYA